MQEYGFLLTRILPYEDDSVFIRENPDQWKPVFLHILRSVRRLDYRYVLPKFTGKCYIFKKKRSKTLKPFKLKVYNPKTLTQKYLKSDFPLQI